MPGSQQLDSLLPPAFEAKLSEFEGYATEIANPSQENVGALRSAEKTVATFLIACAKTNPKADVNSVPYNFSDLRQESLAEILVHDGYAAVLLDHQYETYRNLAMLATGVAISRGDETVAGHGFELGKRIATQRSHRSALAMAAGTAFILSKVTDADDMSLYERAHLVYRTAGLKQTPTINQTDGSRFDNLLGRMRLRDFVQVRPMPYEKRGFVQIIGSSIRTARTFSKITLKLVDPTKAADVIDETFETFMPDVYMEITDNDAEFIARNTAIIVTYLGKAGLKDQVIATDPRPTHLKFLTTRLSKTSVASELARFQKDVHRISRREKDLQKSKESEQS